jgi:hypothetical protein
MTDLPFPPISLWALGGSHWYVEVGDKGIWVEEFQTGIMRDEEGYEKVGSAEYKTSLAILKEQHDRYKIRPTFSNIKTRPCGSCDQLIPTYDVHYLCNNCRT